MAHQTNEKAILLKIDWKSFKVDEFVLLLVKFGFCTKLESHNIKSDIINYSKFPQQFACLGNKEYPAAVFAWTETPTEFEKKPNHLVLSPGEIQVKHILSLCEN